MSGRDDRDDGHDEAAARATAAEHAVRAHYVRHVGRLAWPRATWPQREGLTGLGDEAGTWHYWWHAHLVDAQLDALRRAPRRSRAVRLRALVRGVRLRNGGRWTNAFHDDVAWMGLALHRAGRAAEHERVADRIADRLEHAVDPVVGAVPWHVGGLYFNAPANGPAAILLARTGRLRAAARVADWLDDVLVDRSSGLVLDGVGADGVLDRAVRSYCQGVGLAAQWELSRRDGDGRFGRRTVALVDAIDRWRPDGVLPGSGGGDGGLFAGITCRYLALVADGWREERDASRRRAAGLAASLVRRSADAAWAGRADAHGRPVFAADWAAPATLPAGPAAPARPSGGTTGGSVPPERDLSVQLGGWLALEAAASLGDGRRARRGAAVTS